MSIEDHLGKPGQQTSDGPFLGPLDHGPDERCPGRDNPGLTEYDEVRVDVYQEAELDGVHYQCMHCTGCGKQWWEEA